MANPSHMTAMAHSKKLRHALPLTLSISLLAAAVYASEAHLLQQAEHPAPLRVTLHSDDGTEFIEESGLQPLSAIDKATPHIPSISVRFQSALDASRSGDLDKAAALYRGIVKEKPNHQMAAINLALIQQRKDQWSTSLITLKQVASVAGGSRKGKIYALMARAYEEQDQADQAITYYNRSITYRPAHVNTWRRLTEVSARSQQPYAAVIDLFDKTLSLSGGDPRLALRKAEFQFLRLDFDAARQTLNQHDGALLSQSRQHYRFVLGLIISLEQGHASDIEKQLASQEGKNRSSLNKTLTALAKHQYQLALDALPSKPPKPYAGLTQWLTAYLHQQLDQPDNARKALQAMSALPYFQHQARYQLAQLESTRPDSSGLSMAKQQLTALLIPNVFTADVERQLSVVSARMGQAANAIEFAEQALRNGDQKRRFLLQRIEVEQQFGALSKAQTMAERLVAEHGNSREALRLLASILERSGQVSDAITQYQKLTHTNAAQNDLKKLAELLQQNQQTESSIAILKRLLEQHSGDTDARYLLARNLCDTGDYLECKKQAHRVLKLDQQHAATQQLLDQLAQAPKHG